MRLRSLPGLLLATLILLGTGGSAALAQFFWEDSSRYPTVERFRPAPSTGQRPVRSRGDSYGGAQSYYSGQPYYPGMPVYPGVEQQRPAYRERYAYPSERYERRRVYRPSQRRRAVPAAPRLAQTKPKVEPSTFIVVLGDALGEQVSSGLEDAYEQKQEIEVVDETKEDTGLVRSDAHDWVKHIQDYLNGKPKITAAVVMLGANDRQAIREGETSLDP